MSCTSVISIKETYRDKTSDRAHFFLNNFHRAFHETAVRYIAFVRLRTVTLEPEVVVVIPLNLLSPLLQILLLISLQYPSRPVSSWICAYIHVNRGRAGRSELGPQTDRLRPHFLPPERWLG